MRVWLPRRNGNSTRRLLNTSLRRATTFTTLRMPGDDVQGEVVQGQETALAIRTQGGRLLAVLFIEGGLVFRLRHFNVPTGWYKN